MVLTMLVLIATLAGPQATPTPPPTIANTKSSPLCTAVRDTVAPALGGLIFQDRILAHGESLMQDMWSAGDGFTLDNIHLGIDVYHLAANNIKIHQAIDRLRAMKLPDPQADADLAQLRVRMQAIADSQAAELNLMSGISESNDLADIANVGNLEAAAISASRGTGAPAEGTWMTNLAKRVQPRGFAGLVAQNDRNTQAAEATLLPALLPVINRCR